ncbi:alpha/beta fold hydrolase [Amycolatopsis thermophila]|uniref:Pimeloyl-ACP methyl ester carboxylesterase n=1 Tax=Amycolatopsis thermophila TaxID=206084 RepID=A0ABU0EUK4_9PSEU|nr:alpha/beta fold hydrolase [Amycolatopsis thermophila]MDQ0378989.1 pimeloyl-ACP methyl ester carboxylesterase [Amycolatopsis thermophila]
MTEIRVNGVDLAYDEAGAGPAVVFVHAGAADRRLWNHQFAALADGFRVIRYDQRGFGESGDAPGDHHHYRDLLGLLDALDVDRAALVGCSMGGSYSIEAALAAPERVAALVLICSGLSGHEWPESMRERAAREVHSAVPAERLRAYAARTREPDPADVEAMARAQARFLVPEPGELVLDMLRGVFRRTWTGPQRTERHLEPAPVHRLGEVAAPTLVINGCRDVSEIQRVSDLLSGGIRGARRVDLPDAGHLPPVERPEQVTAELRAFLTERHSGR